jgi:RNA polymerase sigma-70 factor (ECF subfamily)
LAKRAAPLQLSDGEKIDWDQFFELYYLLIGRFSRKLRCPDELVDDVAYQVWDYVLNKLPDFQYDPAKGRFRSWLFRIVRSKTIDAVRRTAVARKAVAGQQDTDFWHNLVDPDGRTPDDDWELAWEEEAGRIVWERYQQEVQDATQTRNSQSRAWELRVIETCVRDGRSAAAVAQELGIQPDYARKLKERGKLRLRVIAAELFGLPSPRSGPGGPNATGK